MPRITPSDMDTGSISGLSGYHFSAVRPTKANLGAMDYTLVTVAVDVSGSVNRFEDLLAGSLVKTVKACKLSPRAHNILLRVVKFNHTVQEVHGFKPLAEIDEDLDYQGIKAGGGTALYDACASAIGATTEYGRVLADKDYGVNAILFVITDGDDRDSTYTADTVREKTAEAVTDEMLQSFISVLIGINAAQFETYLKRFQTDAGLTAYVDAGDATPGNLGKLAAFVSRSVSSQANQLVTGQASVDPASIVI